LSELTHDNAKNMQVDSLQMTPDYYKKKIDDRKLNLLDEYEKSLF
jgi:hypothetical protein